MKLDSLDHALKCFVRDEFNQGLSTGWKLESYTVVLLIRCGSEVRKITINPKEES